MGFAPVPAGASKIVPGLVAALAQTEGMPRLFGALLDLMTPAAPAPVEFALASEAAIDTATTGLLQAPLPPAVELTLEAPAEPRRAGDALLADLVEALAALDLALANGEPPSPTLTEKLAETLDVLAGLLGIPQPVEPVVDPALAAAAKPVGTSLLPAPADLDALPAPVAGAAPLLDSESLFVPVADAGASLQPGAVSFSVPIVPAVDNAEPVRPLHPLPAVASFAATIAAAAVVDDAPPALVAPTTPPPGADVAAAAPALDPDSGLGQLVNKLAEVARTLESHSPGLAKRLDALADRLRSGEVSAQTLVDLGIGADIADGELDQALQKLLSATSTVKGTPALQAFVAAELKLPEIIALPPRAKSAEPPAPPAAGTADAPEAEPEIAPEPALRFAPQARAPEPRDRGEPQPVGTGGASDLIKAAAVAKADAPAEPAATSQLAVPAATNATMVVTGAKAIHAAYQAPVHQINIPQVAFEVVRQLQAGNSRFQIRLDPPELGRIDVKLDVDGNGNVNARMTVERAETLDLMQRDQRALERALAQAGLDSSKTNLEFSLRQNPFAREHDGDGRGQGPAFGGDQAAAGGAVPEPIQTLYRGSASAGGVNLFV